MKLRKRGFVITLFLAAAILLLPAFPFSAKAGEPLTAKAPGAALLRGTSADDGAVPSSSPVTMDVTYGYGGLAKSGRYVPVHFTLENQSQEGFSGTIRIQAMESDYDIYDYDYPLKLQEREKAEKSVDIPVGRAELLYVKLFDDDGQELMRKRLKINVSQDAAELLVGVLSDSSDRLDYLDGVGVDYSTVKTRTFHMSADTMPDKAIGLDLLDVLLITDYDTRKLTDSQVGAVWEWVKGGGTLLIGTGKRADDALAAFQKELLESPVPEPTVRSVDMGVEYATNQPGDSFIDLPCADISLKGGVEVISNDQFPVLTSVSRGKGIVGVAAYDFVDIASFCESQHSYVDKLLTTLLGEDRLGNLSSYLYNGNSSRYWSVQSILNTGNVDKLPSFPLYAAAVLGYILLAGPVLYLLLKRQERRRFYRLGLVGLSLLFATVIYLMGTGTRFRNTFFTYGTILDSSEKTVDEYTYINVRTPYNKPYSVSLDPSYDLLPITRSGSYDMTPAPRFTGNEDYKVKVAYEADVTKISAQNVVAFTPRYFSLAKKTPNVTHQGLTGNVTLFDGAISGTITNHYPFPVEKVGVMIYGQMAVVDSMKPGETVPLNGLPVINYPLNNSYLIAGRVTGRYEYDKPDIENKTYMLALSRANILGFYLDNYSTTYSPEARIVAFGTDQSDGDFLTGGDYETYGTTMYTSALDVSMDQGGYTYRFALMRSPRVVSGQYYSAGNYALGVDPVTLEYYLGNDLEVKRLDFEKLSDEFVKEDKSNSLTMFSGSVYFYNHDTGLFDLMPGDKSQYGAGELRPYLSPGNTMTVKYVFDNMANYSWVNLPLLTVLGKDK